MRHKALLRITEELEIILATPDCLCTILMHREGRDDRDVCIHIPTQRHAFVTLNGVIVNLRPVQRLLWVNKRKGQRANAVLRRDFDRVTVSTGHPQFRMRILHWLRQYIATGHREALTVVARVGRKHHHVADLLRRLECHRPLVFRRDTEGAQLEARCTLADTEFHPPIRQQVERRQALRCAGRVIIVRDHLADAMTQPDSFGLTCRSGQEHFWR